MNLRHTIRLVPILVAAALLASCASIENPFGKKDKTPFMETGNLVKTFQSQVTGKERKYGMFVPTEYNEAKKKKWPVILFLHGMGECGEDPQLLLKHGPLKEAIFRAEFPFIVVAPQSPKRSAADIFKGNGWEYSEPDIMNILAEVKKDYRVDEDRIYLTGISMGGFGSYALAAKHPGMFAAVVPICGGGKPENAAVYVGTPFWIFHGEKDHTVPVKYSKDMYAAMKAAGVDVELTLYPNVDHDSWTATYKLDALYPWLLSHKLGKPATSQTKEKSKKKLEGGVKDIDSPVAK